ncbi:hypothetical protein [Amycolatopsis sp. WAC 01416]|uniref:hypothetical protein n=1 Tax=Amycolatopsis sp. WAC 01416 TaxID=2203196 RepID=UPI001F2F601B|nr:hypothetical protein [Amycolatopsis sp. WAC 01416]
MLALAPRAREGGSYGVQVSLCRSSMLVQRQGSIEENTVYGDLKSLGPVIRMSETPPRWPSPTPRLGSSPA